MIEHEGKFESADGCPIFYREWLPQMGKIRGIVFILHGINEHSGRYRHVAAALTDARLVCYAIDHRGHGRSGGLRGYIPDLNEAVDDFEQLFHLASKKHPQLPPFIFAHSMGSLIGLAFVLRQPPHLRGIVLSGVAIHGERTRPAWLVSLLLLAARFIPKVRISPRGPDSILTRDEGKLQEWREDPLVEKRMWRIGTSAALVRKARAICASVQTIHLPLLAMHGGADKLAPASGAHFLVQQSDSSDAMVKIYSGLRHEVVNEIERDQVIKDLREWLLARC
ncbi:MAG: lysophospholipase [Chloroflexi bacterium]|nr:lysophospholipase [Chloroflexota bacterium]